MSEELVQEMALEALGRLSNDSDLKLENITVSCILLETVQTSREEIQAWSLRNDANGFPVSLSAWVNIAGVTEWLQSSVRT